MQLRRNIVSLLLCLVFLFSHVSVALAADTDEPQAADAKSSASDSKIQVDARSAILICTDTGDVLYAQNEYEKQSPASVTKIASLLVIMDAIESGRISLEDEVTASEAAVEKGGSQIWLEVGEVMTVDELLKATVIASANDACAALGEYIAGSEQAFVKMMNEKVVSLGLENSNFENCTGLDDTITNHYSCAYDLAFMSKELIAHPLIREYSTVWLDYLRGGETELANTNKLVNSYNGITGLKTGTTSAAGFCLSATATRDGMGLCAVVLGCETSEARFDAAASLLDYGFANYKVISPEIDEAQITSVKVKGGIQKETVPVASGLQKILVDASNTDVQASYSINTQVEAPVKKGDVLGSVTFASEDGNEIAKIDLVAQSDIGKISIKYIWLKLLCFMGR